MGSSAVKSFVESSGLGLVAATILSLAVCAVALPCRAADLTIADFVGRFRGEARSEADDRFFVAALRNIEVEVAREGEGFRLAWSTLILDGGSPARLRESVLHFLAASGPGRFRTAEPLEPFAGRPAAWAAIAGNALTVRVLTIAADGSWELQTYVRALAGDTMTLRFTRIAPGKADLVVVGELTRKRD